MHASLAVTPEGLPLGAGAVKVWSRAKLEGPDALERQLDRTRIAIEAKKSVRWLDNLRQSTELIGAPGRCVHIGDRESDICELFCLARELGTNFLVRSCVDRLAEGGGTTIARVMRDVAPPRHAPGRLPRRVRAGAGRAAVGEVRDHDGAAADREAAAPRPSAAADHPRPEEIDPPPDRPPPRWKLITNPEVTTHDDAVHKLGRYARRWSIETFKTLKSGCRIEDARLTTADRLANLIALCCVVAWRIHWLTMLRRGGPDAPLRPCSPTRRSRSSTTPQRGSPERMRGATSPPV